MGEIEFTWVTYPMQSTIGTLLHLAKWKPYRQKHQSHMTKRSPTPRGVENGATQSEVESLSLLQAILPPENEKLENTLTTQVDRSLFCQKCLVGLHHLQPIPSFKRGGHALHGSAGRQMPGHCWSSSTSNI